MSDVDPANGPTGRHEATAFIIIGLIGIPLLAIAAGALVLPPGISFVLVRRGLAEDHMTWVALGGIIGAMWLAMLYATARKFMHRGQRAAAAEQES